jgi:phage terminase small subunit
MAKLKNKRRERFCKLYVSNGFNATRAARGAGFSADTAYSAGPRLLKDVEVSNRVMEMMNTADELLDMSLEEAVHELNVMSKFNIQDFYDDAGRLIPIEELDPDVAANLHELKIDPETGVPVEIKAGKDKTKALDMILRIKNAYDDHQKAGSGTINVYLDDKDMKA